MVKDGQKTAEQSVAELDFLRKESLVKFLRDQIGKPYLYAAQPGDLTSFDCSSLMKHAYATIGLDIARTSRGQATMWGRPIELQEEYEPGDLLFFSDEEGGYNALYPQGFGIGHVSMYVGDGKLIHAIHGDVKATIEENITDFLDRRAAQSENGEPDFVIALRIIEGDIYHHKGQAKPMPQFPVVSE